jgi:predicted RNase H-like HicB family nuclease
VLLAQGETKEEARCNVEEALGGAIICYLEDGVAIPWQDVPSIEIPNNAEVIGRYVRIYDEENVVSTRE